MKIAIVGGGSIGLLFTYYFSRVHDVVLFVRNDSQRARIETDGITLNKNNKSYTIHVKVKRIEDWEKEEKDLSIICVKQYHLQELFETIRVTEKPFLFLQNGMGHIEYVETLNMPALLFGVVEHGAQKTDENTVIHTGAGKTKIAICRGLDKHFVQLLIEPCHSIFPFEIEVDYEQMLKKKLVVNGVINPLTAILRVRNGVLIQNPYFFQLCKQLFSEIALILQLESEQEYFEHVLHVCKSTSANKSSMLRDLEENRLTEIDAILGYLKKEAEKNELRAPLVSTLYQLVKGRELEKGGN